MVVQVTVVQAGPATLTVLDVLGRAGLVQPTQLPAGASQVVLPGAALATGLYLLHVR